MECLSTNNSNKNLSNKIKKLSKEVTNVKKTIDDLNLDDVVYHTKQKRDEDTIIVIKCTNGESSPE